MNKLTRCPARGFWPSWSPDGSQIVFASDRDRSNSNYDIYVMNSDGLGMTRLTGGLDRYFWPTWSPDGSEIAYSNPGVPSSI